MPANSLERAALGFLLVTLYLGTACLLRRYWAYLRKRNAATPPAPARWTLALVDSQTGMSHVLDIDDSPSICCRRRAPEHRRSSLRSLIERTAEFSRRSCVLSLLEERSTKVQGLLEGLFPGVLPGQLGGHSGGRSDGAAAQGSPERVLPKSEKENPEKRGLC